MPKKACTVRFPLRDKLRIIEEYEASGGSFRNVAEKWQCHHSTVQNIVHNKAKWKSFRDGGASASATSTKQLQFESVDQFMWKWHNIARSRLMPTSTMMYRTRALKFASDAGITGFTASSGWLSKFFIRHGIQRKIVAGESGSVDERVVAIWTKERLPELIAEYDQKDIFNADEFGLWYQMLPNSTYATAKDACKGGKQSKLRLTVLVAANATGTEKLKPLVIGTAQNPRCFKNIDKKSLPVIWQANKSAWMTTVIFENWLTDLNNKMAAKGRKILLLIDNAPTHCDIELSNVRIEFLPANTTSRCQPFDAGIIKDVKAKFRTLLMQKIVSLMDDERNAFELAKEINVLMAVEWIGKAWEQVSTDTIAHCFAKVGVKQADEQAEVRSVYVDSDYAQMRQIMQAYFSKAGTVEAYIACDDELPITDLLPENGWEEVLTEQCKPRENADGDVEEEEDDEMEGEITELDMPDPEPKLMPLKDVNKLLDSISYTVQSRHPALYSSFALFRDGMLAQTPLPMNLQQKVITDFFHRV